MARLTRFGRRLALPSTRQIRHELLVLMADDEARLKAAALVSAQAEGTPVTRVDV